MPQRQEQMSLRFWKESQKRLSSCSINWTTKILIEYQKTGPNEMVNGSSLLFKLVYLCFSKYSFKQDYVLWSCPPENGCYIFLLA